MGRCGFFNISLVVLLLLVTSSNVAEVEAFPVEDLVVSLPGQPKVTFRQYAGYVDVDVKNGRSLFYYFVEADVDPYNKPLTLWFNGGPSCSSITSAFKIGPFFATSDNRGLQRSLTSWNTASNLLFVDSPAGVGWSYSNTSSDYECGDISTAKDMHIFMMNWFEKFPEFKSRRLFLTGASYAGHYIPQLANVLLDHNMHSKGFKFNIKGIAIGNPLLKLKKTLPTIYEFFWSHGIISDEMHQTIQTECDFDSYIFENKHNISDSCNATLDEANKIVEFIDQRDVMYDVCHPKIAEEELHLRKMTMKMSVDVAEYKPHEILVYLNLPEVQKALHANQTNLPHAFLSCSKVVNYSRADVDLNMMPLLKRIIQNGIPVWVFSGDQDSTVPLINSRTLIRELAYDLNFKVTVPYRAWYHKKQVGGWVTEYGNLLTFATVRGAAHMAPYSQPSKCLHLFSSFVRGQRLPKMDE